MEDNKNMNGKIDVFDEIGLTSWHFSKVIKDIFYKVTGLEVSEEKYAPDSNNKFNKQISGIVVLKGDKNIMISISMSYRTAAALVANMTNLSSAEVKLEEQSDGIMELTNMIAGQTKAKLASVGLHYSYLQPFTIVGDNHCVLQKRKVSSMELKFHSGEIEMLLSVYVQ